MPYAVPDDIDGRLGARVPGCQSSPLAGGEIEPEATSELTSWLPAAPEISKIKRWRI